MLMMMTMMMRMKMTMKKMMKMMKKPTKIIHTLHIIITRNIIILLILSLSILLTWSSLQQKRAYFPSKYIIYIIDFCFYIFYIQLLLLLLYIYIYVLFFMCCRCSYIFFNFLRLRRRRQNDDNYSSQNNKRRRLRLRFGSFLKCVFVNVFKSRTGSVVIIVDFSSLCPTIESNRSIRSIVDSIFLYLLNYLRDSFFLRQDIYIPKLDSLLICQQYRNRNKKLIAKIMNFGCCGVFSSYFSTNFFI